MSKILIIDDDAQNRDLASRILKRNGYDVVHVESGEAGILMAEAEMPDLIFMDLAMPDIDGFEAAQRIKDAPGTRAIPIIALTAFVVREETRNRALESGFDDFESKPVNSRRLLAKIAALLSQSR
jgi:two-component system cell cycle response regulator DivK